MRKHWPALVTLASIVVVLAVVVRSLSLSILTSKKEQAVAELQNEIQAAMKDGETAAPAPALRPPSSAPVAEPVNEDVTARWIAVAERLRPYYDSLCEPANCSIATRLFAPMWLLDCHRPSEAELECLRAILSDANAPIDEVYSLCTNPATIIPLDGPLEDALSGKQLRPSLLSVFASLELLAMRAYLDACDENCVAAKDEILAAARQWNGPLQKSEKTLIAALFETVYAQLRADPPDVAGAKELINLFQSLEPPQFHRVVMANTAAESIRDLTDYREYYEAPLPWNVAWWGYTTVCKPLYEYDVQQYAQGVKKLLEVSGLPYYQAVPTMRQVATELQQRPIPRPPYAMVRGFRWHANVWCERQTAEDLMRIAVAVNQYRAAESRYPVALDGARDYLDGAVPVEPFSGGPYAYSPVDGGFTLSCRIPVLNWGTDFDKSDVFTW